MKYQIEQWFLWLMIYSFVGWVYESVLCSATGKKLVNRGFLNGPICPIYGVGAVAVIYALLPLRDNLPLLFLLSAVLTTTIEYIASWLMEVLFHARWWDYSKRFMNIRGRVCLLSFVAFGSMSVLAIHYVHPWVQLQTDRLSPTAMHVLCSVFAILFLGDLTTTLVTVLGIDKRLKEARLLIEKRLEERIPALRGLHAFQMKRLSLAFPNLEFTRYREEWKRIREKLKFKPKKMDDK